MGRTFWLIGCGLGFAGVAAGAFGAHALRGRLGPEMLAVWETAVRFQMYHALALLATAWGATHWSAPAVSLAGWLLTAGTLIFSGSLYVLVLSGSRWLGAVTPVGGLLLLAGWVALGCAALKR